MLNQWSYFDGGPIQSAAEQAATVLGAHKLLEDAWWSLLVSYPQDWAGGAAQAAEQKRSALMERVFVAKDMLLDLHGLLVARTELTASASRGHSLGLDLAGAG